MIKFNAAINQSYLKSSNGNLYLEEISGGILYIFKDLVTFQQMHTPLLKFSVSKEKQIKSIDPAEATLLLGDQLQSAENFPANGLQYFLTSDSHPIKELFPYLSAYYLSIHPRIQVYMKDEEIIVIDFPVFEAARRSFEISYYISRSTFTPTK
jgi:hypothetical protein